MKKGPDMRGDFAMSADGAENKQAQISIASKQRMEALEKQLSKPQYQVELTPQGTAVREVRTARDQEIRRQIELIRQRLEAKRHVARDGFNRAHDAGLKP